MAALLIAAGLLVRYGVLTPQGRALVQSAADGLMVGRYGRLGIEGLQGDVFGAFSLRRLTVSDAQGVWLEADRVAISWSPGALLARRLQIDGAEAEAVRVLRRPVLAPPGPPSTGGLPVSLDLRKVRFRLETLPAFSVERGLFDVSARLRVSRDNRGESGSIAATSLLHAGDALNLRFDLRRRRPLLVSLNAVEARGGALAGTLGLPASQPLSASVRASGSLEKGSLDAVVRSGASTPLQAYGTWGAAGGTAAGRILLDASSLTRPYARMLGRQAVLAAAARPAPGELDGVAALVRTGNVTASVQGLADLNTFTSVQGLSVGLAVADVSRIVPGPATGAGRVQGRLTGSPSAWRLAGALQLDRLAQAGVALTRISGPVTVAGRPAEIDVQASLAAAGAGGPGLAGLIGPTPRASFEVARLADGRLLLRSASAAGAGLKLSASGRRGLLGGVNLGGRVDLTNLALLRPGAGGALALTWTAAQASPRAGWSITLDGEGHDARSGLPELDRLLGTAPRLRLRAGYAGGALSLAEARLDGAKAALDAAGRIDARGGLDLKGRWRAEGPFQAGPVQITGRADGREEIAGSLSAPRADLEADFAAIDVPDLPLTAAHLRLSLLKAPEGLDGQVRLDASSGYGPARAASAFHVVKGGLDLTQIDADAGGVKASGALSLRGAAPSTADLLLAIGPGALLSQGHVGGSVKIVDGGAPSAAIDLTAAGAELRGSGLTLQDARLTASGPLERLPFQASGQGSAPEGALRVSGSGVYEQRDGTRQISFTGSGRFQDVDLKTLEPVTIRFAGKERDLHGQLELGGGRMDVDARQAGEAVQAVASLHGVDLKALTPDFQGKVDADVSLRGSGPDLGGSLTARLAGARGADSPSSVAMDGVVKASLSGRGVDIDADLSGAKGLKATLTAVLPVEASAAPLRIAVPRDRPIQGRFSANGEIQPLWDLVYGGERRLSGQARIEGTLGGDLNGPQVTGAASVTNGGFSDDATGLRLTDLSLNADVQRDAVSLTSLAAKDGKGGSVSGSGGFSLARGGASNLRLDLTRFRLIDNDTAEATASGQAAIVRNAAGQIALSGDLTLDRAQINAEAPIRPSVVTMDVVERNKPARLQEQTVAVPERGPPVTLNVRLRAPGHVMVKGRGLNVELSLDASVTGPLSSPDLTGEARVVQGSYDFAGKRFIFDDQGRITLANTPDRIRLDLSASWEQPSLTADIKIAGTAAKPDITLTSTPSLPQDEIMSQVLFGTSASQLSGPQTAQIASTVTSLASGGGFDVLGGLRQIAGLDRLALGGDQTSGTTVAGGKYIGDNVYIEIVGGGRQGPSAEVDWTIHRGLQIVSQAGGEFGAKIAVRWTHDIGKRRTAAPKGKG